jgi:hypothetical protein
VVIDLREDYDEGHRVVTETYGAADSQQERVAAPVAINVDTVQWIVRHRRFQYRGREYRIVKVPALEGIALEYAIERARALLREPKTRDALIELEGLFGDAFALMWRLTREYRWWRKNPFETMTVPELEKLSGFYFECRMLLPDLALVNSLGSKTRKGDRLRSILPIALRSSWNGSRRGSMRKGGR